MVGSVGGSEKVWCALASGLSSRGHEVHAWCADPQEGQPFYPLDARVHFQNLRGASRHKLRAWWRLRHALRVTQPDVVICFYLRDFFSVALAWRSARCVLMLHCEPQYYQRKMAPWKWWLLRRLQSRLKKVQVLLPSYVEAAQRLSPEVVVIPNGVPWPPVIEPARDSRVVVSVARFDRGQKQQHVLIQAFAQALKSCPGWTLELWGSQADGTYVEACRALTRALGIEAHVLFAGTSDQLASVYQRAAFLALPSRYEGFPLVLLEAEGYGLPVVGLSSCQALAGLVTHGVNGLLAESEMDFAEHLIALMRHDQKRLQMGEKARQHAAQYDISHMLALWEQTLAQVLHD